MKNRTRLILLAAVLLSLIPVTYFVNRDTTVSDDEKLQRAVREDHAFLEGKIPVVTVRPTTAPAGYRNDYHFRADFFLWNIPVWDAALAEFKGKPDVQYLEVGVFEGRSALWIIDNILTHPTSHFTGIDPFIDVPGFEGFKDVFLANLNLSGAQGRSTIVTGFSQIELRKLPLESYDIIYIDGSHEADDVLEDAVLSHRLLKKGGVLIFDDYLWQLEGASNVRPKPAIDVFYAFFKDDYDVVHNGYQLLLKKKSGGGGAATRPTDWMPQPATAPAQKSDSQPRR